MDVTDIFHFFRFGEGEGGVRGAGRGGGGGIGFFIENPRRGGGLQQERPGRCLRRIGEFGGGG